MYLNQELIYKDSDRYIKVKLMILLLNFHWSNY